MMSVTTTKSKLHKLIDSLPEHVAEQLLDQARTLVKISNPLDKNSEFLKKIFQEDKEVLTNLAK